MSDGRDLPRLHLDGPSVDDIDGHPPDPLFGDANTRVEMRNRDHTARRRMASLSLMPEDTLIADMIDRACVIGACWGSTPADILREIADLVGEGAIPEQEPLRQVLLARKQRQGTSRDARRAHLAPSWGGIRGGDVDEWPVERAAPAETGADTPSTSPTKPRQDSA